MDQNIIDLILAGGPDEAMLKGGAGTPMPAGTPATPSQPQQSGMWGTPIQYNEGNGSLVQQIRAIAQGRPILGTRNISNYQDTSNYVASSEADGGDAGTYRTVYRPRDGSGLSGNNETGVYFRGSDGRDYARVPMSRANSRDEGFSARELGFDKQPELINQYLGINPQEWSNYSEEDRNRILDNTFLKPDNVHGLGDFRFDPERGLVTPTSNLRDADARHNMWLDAGMFVATAAPAIYGIASGAGVTPGAEAGPAPSGSPLDPYTGPPDGPGPTPSGPDAAPTNGGYPNTNMNVDPFDMPTEPLDTSPIPNLEMPSVPEVDPSRMLEYTGENWYDRLLRAARGLPSLSQALGGSGGSSAGGARSGGGGSSLGGLGGGGGGSGRGGRLAEVNADVFAKAGLTPVGDLVQYLRGKAK